MKHDVVQYLEVLERYGEDNIWRTAKAAREEIELLRCLIVEMHDLSKKWPGIAYAYDLDARVRAASPPNV